MIAPPPTNTPRNPSAQIVSSRRHGSDFPRARVSQFCGRATTCETTEKRATTRGMVDGGETGRSDYWTRGSTSKLRRIDRINLPARRNIKPKAVGAGRASNDWHKYDLASRDLRRLIENYSAAIASNLHTASPLISLSYRRKSCPEERNEITRPPSLAPRPTPLSTHPLPFSLMKLLKHNAPVNHVPPEFEGDSAFARWQSPGDGRFQQIFSKTCWTTMHRSVK